MDKIYICNDIIKNAKDEQEKQRATFEINSLNLLFMTHHWLGIINEFDMEHTKPAITTFIQLSTEESACYYENRFSQTNNLFDKWRYAFSYWILKKDPDYLNHAISLLLQCSQKRLSEENYIECIHLLVKTFNICRVYNLATIQNVLCKRIITLAIEIIHKLHRTEHSRWMDEPAIILGTIRNSVTPEQAHEVLSIVHYEANEFRKQNNQHLQEMLLEASLGLCSLTGLSTTDQLELRKIIQMMIGDSLIEEGSRRLADEDDGALVTVLFYQKAIKKCQLVGNQNKIDDLNVAIRDATSKIKWKTIESRFEMPRLKFTATDEYSLIEEIIDNTLASMPSVRISAENTKENLKKSLRFAVSNVSFNEKNPTSFDNTEESITKSSVTTELSWQIQLTDKYIASSAADLENDGKVTAEGYCKFLADCGLHDESSLKLICTGIERHFAKDYVSSIHVLIPQIEGTLRTLLNSRGIKTIKTNRNVIMDNELGGMLNEPDTKALLGEDIVTYLRVKYTEQQGQNIRNEISHALLNHKKFTHDESLAAIRVILLLAKLSRPGEHSNK